MICFLFYNFFLNPEQNHVESFRRYRAVIIISVLLFKMNNSGTNSIAGLTDKTGTDVVLNSLVQLYLISNMILPPRATINTLAINNSRFWKVSNRFAWEISILVIDGGRVKLLRLIFL